MSPEGLPCVKAGGQLFQDFDTTGLSLASVLHRMTTWNVQKHTVSTSVHTVWASGGSARPAMKLLHVGVEESKPVGSFHVISTFILE